MYFVSGQIMITDPIPSPFHIMKLTRYEYPIIILYIDIYNLYYL